MTEFNKIFPTSPQSAAQKVAIFGISANPPTGLNGHTGIVRYLARCGIFNEVWILPVYQHIYSNKPNLVDYSHRLEMCRLCMEPETHDDCVVRVLPLEMYASQFYRALQGDSYKVGTIDVLDMIRRTYPKLEIHLVLGGDTYNDLIHKKWKESDRLLNETTVHVIGRLTEESKQSSSQRHVHHSFSFPDPIQRNVFHHKVHTLTSISSTKVRSLTPALIYVWPFDFGDQLQESVHPAVLNYMIKNRLYGFTAAYSSNRIQWSVLGLSAVYIGVYMLGQVISQRLT